MRTLSALLLLAAVGCATAAAPAPEPVAQPEATNPPPAAADLHATFPYTAEQIRDATPSGRRIHLRVTREDESSYELIREFVAVDDDRCTVRNSLITPTGAETGLGESRPTWAELRAHAAFPAAQTTVTDADVVVPAGAFACRLYTVTEPSRMGTKVRKVWFARDVPGPPVKQITTIDGEVVAKIELIENRLP